MTDEEIRAQAESKYFNDRDMDRFCVGAKWHRERSEAKMKELRDHYETELKAANLMILKYSFLSVISEKTMLDIINTKEDAVKYREFIEQLNAIIES